jgi:hypothetical protein
MAGEELSPSRTIACAVFLCGWGGYSIGKGPRTEFGDCGVGISDILSLTKIDIPLHPSPNPLHAEFSASPSLEVSLSSACIIRHEAFRVDAGWQRGDAYSRGQRI